MGIFQKKIGPVFLKETSDATVYIEKMQLLLEQADEEMKKEIEKQIKLAKYGEYGEQNVAFELKNSGMDMYILHDLYFETTSGSAQIDYIVITRKRIYVLECKNLIGNIEIDNVGSFIRTYELFGKWIKEGIYSPITQNQRHLQVLKEMRKESKSNFLMKMMFEKNFYETYKSVVVLANPKTYLNAKYAKKEIKQQVIRADQLIAYIKEQDSFVKDLNMSEKEMFDLATFFMQKNVPEHSDYAKKYEEIVSNVRDAVKEGKEEKEECSEMLTEKLKKFRLEQSRKEGIKPYYIFNDAQMKDLIAQNPKTKEELLKVSGFGNVKVEKYGDTILSILHEE